MAKEALPRIVSANDLVEGDVVYLAARRGWTRRIDEAAVAETGETAEALLAAADQPGRVVGPCLVEIRIDPDGRRTPAHFRDRFRETGPTFRPGLGRNATLETSPPFGEGA